MARISNCIDIQPWDEIWTTVSLNSGWIDEWVKIYIPQENMDVITYQRLQLF